jgi:hypothetical protein
VLTIQCFQGYNHVQIGFADVRNSFFELNWGYALETPSEPLPVIGTGILTNGHGFYAVPSSSDPTRCYLVEQWPSKLTCHCKDAFFRYRQCKHILAVTVHKQKIQIEEANAASEREEAGEAETQWGITDAGREYLAATYTARPRIFATRLQEPFSLLKY